MRKPEVKEVKQRTKSEKREAKKRNVKAEWDNLQEEERLAKRLRTGKITQAEYDRLVDGIDYSDEDEDEDDGGKGSVKTYKSHMTSKSRFTAKSIGRKQTKRTLFE